MVKPQHTASALRTFYDSLMSDMRSIATLDLHTTRSWVRQLHLVQPLHFLQQYPLLINPNLRRLNSLRGQRKFHVASVGLPVPTVHFNVNFLSRIESLQLSSSSCASIVSEGVMPLLSVNRRCSVCRQPHHTTLHGASGLQSSLTSTPASVSMHAAPASENTQHGEPTTTPTLPSSFASHNSETAVNPNETLCSCHSEPNTMTSCHSQPNPIILKSAVTSVNNGEITKKANIFIEEGSSLS